MGGRRGQEADQQEGVRARRLRAQEDWQRRLWQGLLPVGPLSTHCAFLSLVSRTPPRRVRLVPFWAVLSLVCSLSDVPDADASAFAGSVSSYARRAVSER